MNTMKTNITSSILAALLGFAFPTALTAQNDIVTYQGSVSSGGTNFTGAGQFKFALVTSTNLNATASATATVSGGFVTLVTPDDPGSGYLSPPAVTIVGGSGSGATATANLSGGEVVSYTVTSLGSGYTGTPTVVVDPPPETLAFTTYWSNDGTSVAGSEPTDAVSAPVNAGLFTVRLGDATLPNMTVLSPALFQQPDLELRIWFDDGVNGFGVLSPTQPLTAAPYAMAVDAGSISDPTFIGTTTMTPLDLFVNNQRGLRLEYATGVFGESVNLIGGYSGNTVGTGTEGAVISGGGTIGFENTIGANADYSAIGGGLINTIASGSYYATVAGGHLNSIGVDSHYSTIGGGYFNNISADSEYSAIGGGYFNNINTGAPYSTIVGGCGNSINDDYGTIGGGQHNEVQNDYGTIGGGLSNVVNLYSVVGGGRNNRATSSYGTIPGGRDNAATSVYTFAAGRRAKANHNGCFVWGDSQNADVASTANDQFLIRAAGGVGIGTTSPASALDVVGSIRSRGSAGGNIGAYNPNNQSASVNLGWVNDVARIRIGGNGAGAQNGLDIQTTGNSSLMRISGSGDVTATSFNPTSDRNAKENFRPVDSMSVLEKVALLEISQWNFKTDSTTPHIGPVAQDFHAAFGVGPDDKHIATVDADGVALAAIQGLNQKLTEELNRRDAENAELRQRLARLERLFNDKVDGGEQ